MNDHSRRASIRKPEPESSCIPRRRLHRTTFLAAAVYNVAWGLLASIRPQWLFELSSMPPMHYPEVFACVGMIVGLYGLVYAEIARRPERGFPFAAVGLAGKVLGPIGWLTLWLRGDWPTASLIVIVGNDLIWWIPFALYLKDSWPFYRRDWRSGKGEGE